VSEPGRAAEIRRILVALDASPHSLPLLQVAAELASKTEAELLGLFVEDIELLRLADSPYACEILYPSATQTPLSRATMELKLRTLSEIARKALAAAASRAQIQWSFRSVRGEILPEVLAAAGEADLLVISEAGGPLGRPRRIASAALELAAGAAPVLLIPARGIAPGARLAVYFDGSPGSRVGLLVSARMAAATQDGITILLGATDAASASARKEEAARLLEGEDIETRYRIVNPEDTTALVRTLRTERPGIFILGGLEPRKKQQWAEVLLRDTTMALLLLGHGETSLPESE
jgi:nucleotide-binding universal stress UspA family protein